MSKTYRSIPYGQAEEGLAENSKARRRRAHEIARHLILLASQMIEPEEKDLQLAEASASYEA